MAADMEAASLKVKIGTEGDDEAGKKVESLGKRIDNVGKSSVKTGSMLTLGLTTPILAFGAASVMSASNTEEAQAKVNTVFGDSAGIITDWSGTTSQALGLSKQDALAATGTFGNMFTSMGLGQEEAANLSTGMVQLAVDTASFNNASTDDALLAMQSALTGEYEALKKYGIVLNDATLSQTAMNMGLGDNFQALTEQEKVLVRQQAIMDQSTNATGDFERTQGGLANQIKIAKAEFENITATLGAMFLPMVTTAMTGVGKFLVKIQSMSPGMQKVIVAIVGLVAAIGPLLIGIGAGIRVAGQMAQAIKGIGMAVNLLTSPIGLVVVAIAGLVLLGIHLYKNWEPFRKLVDKIAASLKKFINGPVLAFIAAMADKVGDAIDAFKEWANGITSWQDLLSKVGDVLRNVGGWVGDLARQVTGLDWNGLLKGAWSAIQTSLEFAWAQLASIDWMAVIGKAVEVGQKIFEWTKETLGAIDWMAILGKAKEIGESIFTWAKETLGAIEWQKLFGQAVNIGSDILGWVKDTLGSIDWMSLLGAAVDIGSNILQWARDTLGSINWRALLGGIVEIGASVFTWVKDTLGSIDWGRILGAAKEVGANVLSWITDTLVSIDWGRILGAAKEVGQSIYNWAKTLLGSIQWSSILGGLLDIGASVFAWAKELFGLIAWTDLFGAAGDLFSDTLSWIKEKLAVPAFDIPSFDDIYAMVLAEVKAWLGVGGSSNPDANGDGLVEPHEQNPDLVGEPQQGFAGGKFSFDTKGAADFAAMLQPIVNAANNARAAVTLFNGEAQKTPPVLGQSQTAAPIYSGAFVTAAASVKGSGSSILGTLTGIAASTLQQTMAARISASNQFSQMQTSVIGHATGMRTGASGQFTAMAGDALAKARLTMGNMTSGIAGGLGSVASNFVSMKTTANSRMSEMASSATTQGTSTMANMVGSLAGGMARVAITMMGLNTAVSNAGSSASTTAYSIGSNISSSFASGMEAFLGRIRSAAAAMVNAASDALRAKAQIASPSKLFRGFGEFVGEGFEQGIASMIPSVAKTSADLVATPLLASPSAYAPTAGSGHGSGAVVNNFHQNFALRSQDLVDLMEKAEKGSSHATAWQSPEALTQFLKES